MSAALRRLLRRMIEHVGGVVVDVDLTFAAMTPEYPSVDTQKRNSSTSQKRQLTKRPRR
jgi:hypothetical protein